jgi:hypothetical protein
VLATSIAYQRFSLLKSKANIHRLDRIDGRVLPALIRSGANRFAIPEPLHHDLCEVNR